MKIQSNFGQIILRIGDDFTDLWVFNIYEEGRIFIRKGNLRTTSYEVYSEKNWR